MPNIAAKAEAEGRMGIAMTGTYIGAHERSTTLAGAGTIDRRGIGMIRAQTGTGRKSVVLAGAGTGSQKEPVAPRRGARAAQALETPRRSPGKGGTSVRAPSVGGGKARP